MLLHQKLTRIQDYRRNSEPLPSGPAPRISSDPFKVNHCNGKVEAKPKARRWDKLWSLESKARHGSSSKNSAGSFKSTENVPTPVSLSIGRPWHELFPWKALSLSHVNPSDSGVLTLTDGNAKDARSPVSCNEGDYEMAVALNYGYATGSPHLLRFVTEHVELVHDPPYLDWRTCLTSGTTAALETILRMFCDRDDWIFVEEFSYSEALEAMRPLGIHTLGIKMDENGLVPEDLDFKLRSWDPTLGKRPRVLYTIPTGQNPTGITQSEQRRRDIYKVAEEWNIYIIEDDAYYFLLLDLNPWHAQSGGDTLAIAQEYLASLPPSYLSFDVSGRVLRLDSSSKILAPGLRCSWMTAASQIVDKFLKFTEVSSVAPSGLSQLALYKLLDLSWGHDGFIMWLAYLSQQYHQRRDALLLACQRHLPTSVCHWSVPEAGMFLWLRLDWRSSTRVLDVRDTTDTHQLIKHLEDRIHSQAKEKGVLVSKGSWFRTGASNEDADLHFRLTFAAAPSDTFNNAIQMLAEVIRAELCA